MVFAQRKKDSRFCPLFPSIAGSFATGRGSRRSYRVALITVPSGSAPDGTPWALRERKGSGRAAPAATEAGTETLAGAAVMTTDEDFLLPFAP